MSRTSSEQRSRTASPTDKGRVVEQIVASMHDMHGVKIQRNVRVPSVKDKRRKREIDVLLTGSIAGYPVAKAFECKNERKPIGVHRIDEFIGKLDDVGIPSVNGIHVSTSGYTKPALDRAKDARVTLLVLTGLTNEGTAASVFEALQSVVYLLLDVTSFTIENKTGHDGQTPAFYDDEGKFCGVMPDLIWQKWLAGSIPSTIGEHEVALTVPPDWQQIVDQQMVPVVSAFARVRVLGLVVTIAGQSTEHSLVDAFEKRVKRSEVTASFDIAETSYPVTAVRTEDELRRLGAGRGSVRVSVGPIRLPRIRVGTLYWPLSERTVVQALGALGDFESGLISDPRLGLLGVEGTDLATIWEPVWEPLWGGYPGVSKPPRNA